MIMFSTQTARKIDLMSPWVMSLSAVTLDCCRFETGCPVVNNIVDGYPSSVQRSAPTNTSYSFLSYQRDSFSGWCLFLKNRNPTRPPWGSTLGPWRNKSTYEARGITTSTEANCHAIRGLSAITGNFPRLNRTVDRRIKQRLPICNVALSPVSPI